MAVRANDNPGIRQVVNDRRDWSPPHVLLSSGHNGGPVPYYTEGFAVVNAAPSDSTADASELCSHISCCTRTGRSRRTS